MNRKTATVPSVEAFLGSYAPPVRRTASALREVVRAAVPDVEEGVRLGWRLIGYRVPIHPARSRYFCFIQPLAAQVHLGFEHGVLLDDPFDLLSGDGKQVRAVVLQRVSACRRPEVAALVRQAAELARGRGA